MISYLTPGILLTQVVLVLTKLAGGLVWDWPSVFLPLKWMAIVHGAIVATHLLGRLLGSPVILFGLMSILPRWYVEADFALYRWNYNRQVAKEHADSE